MSIRSRNCDNTASFAKESMTLVLGTTAVSQTAKRTHAITIPFAFQVVRVEVYALTVTATITVDVQIASTSVLSAQITPVADTPTVGTLSATLANTQSKTSAILSLLYTTNGSGAATNGVVTVYLRPLGMHGDAYYAAP